MTIFPKIQSVGTETFTLAASYWPYLNSIVFHTFTPVCMKSSISRSLKRSYPLERGLPRKVRSHNEQISNRKKKPNAMSDNRNGRIRRAVSNQIPGRRSKSRVAFVETVRINVSNTLLSIQRAGRNSRFFVCNLINSPIWSAIWSAIWVTIWAPIWKMKL